MLYGIPKGATYEEILQTLDDRFGDRHFAVASRYQLKTRIQRVGESPDIATAIEQLVYCAYLALPEDHRRRAAVSTFVDGVVDLYIKFRSLTGGEKTLGEALRQALEIQVVLVAVRLQETNNASSRGSQSPPNRRRDASRSECWSCGKPGHFKDTCPYGRTEANDRRQDGSPRDTQQQPRSERRSSNTQRETRRDGQFLGKFDSPISTVITDDPIKRNGANSAISVQRIEVPGAGIEAPPDTGQPTSDHVADLVHRLRGIYNYVRQ